MINKIILTKQNLLILSMHVKKEHCCNFSKNVVERRLTFLLRNSYILKKLLNSIYNDLIYKKNIFNKIRAKHPLRVGQIFLSLGRKHRRHENIKLMLYNILLFLLSGTMSWLRARLSKDDISVWHLVDKVRRAHWQWQTMRPWQRPRQVCGQVCVTQTGLWPGSQVYMSSLRALEVALQVVWNI